MSSRTCTICFEKKPLADFLDLLKCSHLNNTCKVCWKNHVSRQINEKGAHEILCLECGRLVSDREVKKIASPTDYARYETLNLMGILEKLENFRWCSTPGCGSGQEVEGGEENSFFKCIHCEKKTCFAHKVPWHQDLTCDEYDDWVNTNNENATEDYLKACTKKCPKCSKHIEKDGGCDHMTCRPPGGCEYQFCWLCLADYKSILAHDNSYHNKGCKYYSPC